MLDSELKDDIEFLRHRDLEVEANEDCTQNEGYLI